jgi:hypothetical protein
MLTGRIARGCALLEAALAHPDIFGVFFKLANGFRVSPKVNKPFQRALTARLIQQAAGLGGASGVAVRAVRRARKRGSSSNPGSRANSAHRRARNGMVMGVVGAIERCRRVHHVQRRTDRRRTGIRASQHGGTDPVSCGSSRDCVRFARFRRLRRFGWLRRFVRSRGNADCWAWLGICVNGILVI